MYGFMILKRWVFVILVYFELMLYCLNEIMGKLDVRSRCFVERCVVVFVVEEEFIFVEFFSLIC